MKRTKVFFACLFCWMFASVSVFVQPASGQKTDKLHVSVKIQGVFDSKVSLIPFNGLKAIDPIKEVMGVKKGETATIEVPSQYLPGEFVLRLDYRGKESDNPYPSERNIFINKQSIELSVNPPYINNKDSTKLAADETENTVYGAFSSENNTKRTQLDLIKQLLLSYDRPNSKLYAACVKEFDERRAEYNAWLSEQAKKNHDLYVSRLFQFQYIPEVSWNGDETERLNQLLKNYFYGIDFNDSLIIRSRELNNFMSSYMGLYGTQATTIELRDSLFTHAGRVACEIASKGHPKVYGWMVDYFYNGYETYKIDRGMTMLQQHLNNPNCLTSKKQQIIKRVEGMKKLVPGALAPDFTLTDSTGNNFEFHKWKGKAPYKLLLFWSASCEHCELLVKELIKWYNEPVNNEKIDIVAVSLDETDAEVQTWKKKIGGLLGWKHLRAKVGVNSAVANDYSILSTPVMFLVESKTNMIEAAPADLEELKKDLEKNK